MTTTAEVVQRVRGKLRGSGTELINRLASDPGSSGTTLTFSNQLKNVTEGARLSIGLEDFYVWSADVTTKTAVVERGFESTTPTAHDSGSIVRIMPRASDHEILVALNDELRGLYGEGIYRMDATELTFTPSHSSYALPAEALDVYKVHVRYINEPDGWMPVYGWVVARNQKTSDFASGNSLTFTREGPPSGFNFRVTYRRELGTLSTLTDNVETTTGTPAIALLVLGAEMRLTDSRETARNMSEAQGSTRRAPEVPPGAELGGNRALQQTYQMELFRERSRLARLYPPEKGRG